MCRLFVDYMSHSSESNYVRVYADYNLPKTSEANFAKKIVSLLHAVEPARARERKHPAANFVWVLHSAHDVYVTSKQSKNTQSGFVVLARLWQVCKNLGLRYYLRQDTVEAVARAVQVDRHIVD